MPLIWVKVSTSFNETFFSKCEILFQQTKILPMLAVPATDEQTLNCRSSK